MADETKLILVDQIEPLIHEIRVQKVVLDSDLAALYGVPTKVLNQAIQRNIDRFPPDFRFQLTESEMDSLRSQIVTSNVGRGGRRYLPYVFAEHGVVMAASVLNSPRAVEVSVFVVRAFVKLRQLVLAHKDLAGKFDQLERKIGSHDEAIQQLVAAIRQLMAPPDPPKMEMGFHTIRSSANVAHRCRTVLWTGSSVVFFRNRGDERERFSSRDLNTGCFVVGDRCLDDLFQKGNRRGSIRADGSQCLGCISTNRVLLMRQSIDEQRNARTHRVRRSRFWGHLQCHSCRRSSGRWSSF